MATHRIIVPPLRPWHMLRPSILGRLSRARRVDLLADGIYHAVVFGTYFLLVVGPSAMIGWLIGSAFWLVIRAITYGYQQRDDSLAEERNHDLMEHLAREPGGGPLMADVTGHCGCRLRYAYDPQRVAWLPVGVLDTADSCLSTAR